MKVEVGQTTQLQFDDGAPVRAASAIAPFGDGWLIAQDDETLGAWWRDSSIVEVRLLPPVDGHDRFSEADGTKDAKPDLEAACSVQIEGESAVLLLGSGSLPARMRAVVATPGDPHCSVDTGSLAPLYGRIADALGLHAKDLNLEGACVIGSTLRWFQRGHGGADVPSSSIDCSLADVLAAIRGQLDPSDVTVAEVRRYEFDSAGDVALAITDAALLPDGRILVSVAAEDAPDAVADGEVVGSALGVVDDDEVVGTASIPTAEDGTPYKVEGLAIREATDGRIDLLAVVDADDPHAPSLALELTIDLTEAQ